MASSLGGTKLSDSVLLRIQLTILVTESITVPSQSKMTSLYFLIGATFITVLHLVILVMYF